MFARTLQYEAYRILSHLSSFFQSIAKGADFRNRRHENVEAPFRLRLK